MDGGLRRPLARCAGTCDGVGAGSRGVVPEARLAGGATRASFASWDAQDSYCDRVRERGSVTLVAGGGSAGSRGAPIGGSCSRTPGSPHGAVAGTRRLLPPWNAGCSTGSRDGSFPGIRWTRGGRTGDCGSGTDGWCERGLDGHRSGSRCSLCLAKLPPGMAGCTRPVGYPARAAFSSTAQARWCRHGICSRRKRRLVLSRSECSRLPQHGGDCGPHRGCARCIRRRGTACECAMVRG